MRTPKIRIVLILLFISGLCRLTLAQNESTPKPIPKNRVEIKSLLDALKQKEPRLPFTASGLQNSRNPSVNNAKARAFFLPSEWFDGDKPGLGNNQTDELLSYELKTECFWVVSRANNCHYCLGHQEHKLSIVGLSDDQIAALDHDWSTFDPRTQAALAFTLKLTREPQLIGKEDIEQLRTQFNDLEIIELAYTIARFNSTNRWTDAMGIPQDSEMRGHPINFSSDTNLKWQQYTSIASPIATHHRTLLSDEEVEAELLATRTSTPYVQLPGDEETRAKFELSSDVRLNDWYRALASLKVINPKLILNHQTMITHTELSPRLKLLAMMRTANWNRCWLTYQLASQQLSQMPAGVDQFQDTAHDAALHFVDRLTVQNFSISDQDVHSLRKYFSDRQIAQLIHTTAQANGMDRFCRSLGLRTDTQP